jgi:uncharacterized protein YneF (UPF0154 family)
MTPELVTYILTVSLGILVGLALSAFGKHKYIQWLERKLATARKELAVLRNEHQQPWLQGATTEYNLQKRITELEALASRQQHLMEKYRLIRCKDCGGLQPANKGQNYGMTALCTTCGCFGLAMRPKRERYEQITPTTNIANITIRQQAQYIRLLEANTSKSVLRRLNAQMGDKPCDGDSRL